jgi:hypothetical protein
MTVYSDITKLQLFFTAKDERTHRVKKEQTLMRPGGGGADFRLGCTIEKSPFLSAAGAFFFAQSSLSIQ